METHVERENLSKLEDNSVVIPGYDLMVAHKLAIKAWLPTFYTPTQPDGGRPPPPKLALAPTDDTPIVDAIITPILNSKSPNYPQSFQLSQYSVQLFFVNSTVVCLKIND